MKVKLIFCLIITVALNGVALAQPFQIIDAGELELGTNNITDLGRVTKYFGMNVDGLGDSIIRVSSGAQSSTVEYKFQVTPARLYSYFFPNNLASLSDIYRRGVEGAIMVEILNTDGTVESISNLEIDVTLPKKNCRKNSSSPCKKAVLSKLTKKQRTKFLKAFAKSIKGPIVLEP